MRVFMLGWEFPPFISGGLGTACYGLTRALSRQNVEILFVLPRHVAGDSTTHVKLLSPQAAAAASGRPAPRRTTSGGAASGGVASSFRMQLPDGAPTELDKVIFRAVPSRLPSVYQSAGGKLQAARPAVDPATGLPAIDPNAPISILQGHGNPPGNHGGDGSAGAVQHYAGDLMAEAQRYARLCVDLARGEEFDVVHAHDWMTFPAGMAVAAATGKPLIVHVHSTEFDRSGDNVYQPVYDIERRGVQSACRVIAVSHMTRSILQHRYGLDPARVDVVYNGIDNSPAASDGFHSRAAIRRGDKIVLFLGRITMQKGPEYFIGAAKKVLEKYDRVKFVMAGTGDMVRDVIELAAREGIGHKVLFTGFLRGSDVDRLFKMADVYVMPSVSEPFGIAPLEAISHDVPVIISKTSGVAEVLTHALKVDFWDTHEIANKIIAVLKHPPLSSTLRAHADMEVRRLTWDDSAAKCLRVYESAVEMMPA